MVRLTDGTEIRLLPDEIGRMSVIKDNDYGQMTVGEYLLYSPLKLDSAYAAVGFETNNERISYNLWVPTNDVLGIWELRSLFVSIEPRDGQRSGSPTIPVTC